MATQPKQPKRGQPLLHYVGDPIQDLMTELALERVGRPESAHPLNGTVRIDMAHSVIGCGCCGGVRGGDGIYARGRCPTRRCTCKRR